jgi:septal ring factor EnvC (AmiA/AmiB activator)
MSSRQPYRPVLLLALLLLAGPALAGERQAKEAELKQLRAQIAALQRELDSVRGRYDTLRGELRRTERRIGTLSRKLKELDGELHTRQEKLDTLHGRERTLQRSVAEQREHLGGQIRASYAMGRQEYLKILLNQQSPSTVGRMLTYYDYLNKARSERIEQLNTTLRELERVRAEVEAQTARLRALRDERAQERQALDASRRERKRVITQLREQLQDKGQRLSGMQRDEAQLKSLIQALSEALADIPSEPGNRKPFNTLKGKLQWPASGPLVVSYGSPRKLGKLTWQGVMIGADSGQEVRAVSHGRVAFADWLRGYGLLIILDHGDGFMSLYGHNQSLYRETGDWVEPGEVIATVGDSGGLDRSGLYFEIRKDGKPSDPVRWCRR